jgi:DNA-binding NarL/FixJ family response regulator
MALRILVVDDHEPTRRAITAILAKRPGWRVCGEASDGIEAVARANELRPDAILMDVSMPKMDGLQATRAVRQQLPTTRVIIVSQNDPSVVRQQAAHVQAHAYLAKDAIAKDLIPSIEKLFTDDLSDANVAPPPKHRGEDISIWLSGGGKMGELIRRIGQGLHWERLLLGPRPSA